MMKINLTLKINHDKDPPELKKGSGKGIIAHQTLEYPDDVIVNSVLISSIIDAANELKDDYIKVEYSSEDGSLKGVI